jgi:hypothetical protein
VHVCPKYRFDLMGLDELNDPFEMVRLGMDAAKFPVGDGVFISP